MGTSNVLASESCHTHVAARFATQTTAIAAIILTGVFVIRSQALSTDFSVFIVALVSWPLAGLLRTWALWDFTPFRTDIPVTRIADGSRLDIVGIILRKSFWWLVPFAWTLLWPAVSLERLVSIPVSRSWIPHVVVAVLLLAYLGLFAADALEKRVSVRSFVTAFAKTFAAAGFPEDLLIVGFIGGSLFRLLSSSMAFWPAAIMTTVAVDVAFAVSHIPNVLRNRRFYAQNMTGSTEISLLRSVGQMTAFGLPGWIFFFATGSVWYPVIMHTLYDLAAILPKTASPAETEPV
jgi:hypothetical protein